MNTSSNDYKFARAEMRAEPGFFPMASEPETGEFIAALIHMIQPQAVLELGTHRGHTTLYLVQAMESGRERWSPWIRAITAARRCGVLMINTPLSSETM